MEASCDMVRAILEEWEASGAADPKDYLLVSSHLTVCAPCRRRYSTLLPFIRRDAGGPSIAETTSVEDSEGFVEGTMELLSGARATLPRSRRFFERGRVPRIAGLAAAVVLFTIGALLFYDQRVRFERTEVVVHFVLDAPGAREVALVGSFTAWDPSKLLLKRDAGTSRWEISVPLERGKTYLYNFVINGTTWIPDPSTDVQISDGFGGTSSLIQL